MEFLTNDWFTLIVIAVMILSLSRILQKFLLTGLEIHPMAFSMIYQLLVGLFSLPLAYKSFHTLGTFDAKMITLTLLSCFLYFGANLLFFVALKKIDASEMALITALQIIWYLILGVCFFSEHLTVYKLVGASLIFLGLAVVYYSKQFFTRINLHYLIGILSTIVFALAGTADKAAMKYIDPSLYQVFGFIIPALLTFIFVPKKYLDIRPLLKWNKKTSLLVAISAFYIFAPLCINTAYKLEADASKVGPLMQTSTIIIVLLGIIFLKEKDNIFRKVVGSIIVLLGAVILKANGWFF